MTPSHDPSAEIVKTKSVNISQLYQQKPSNDHAHCRLLGISRRDMVPRFLRDVTTGKKRLGRTFFFFAGARLFFSFPSSVYCFFPYPFAWHDSVFAFFPTPPKSLFYYPSFSKTNSERIPKFAHRQLIHSFLSFSSVYTEKCITKLLDGII